MTTRPRYWRRSEYAPYIVEIVLRAWDDADDNIRRQMYIAAVTELVNALPLSALESYLRRKEREKTP